MPTLFSVDVAEAQPFAGNAAVVGRTIVNNTGCPRSHWTGRALGFATVETRLHEFVQAGGTANRLTLRLDGEEAAS